MSDSLRRAFDAAVGAGYERGHLRGRMGRRNADGSYSLAVPDRPGFVYVTLSSDASQAVDSALNPYVARIVNLPVKMRRIGGSLVIVGMDDSPGAIESFVGDATGAAVGPHNHRTGSGLEYEVESFWLEPGRVLWSGSGVTVRIRPLHYRHEGTEKYFPGGTLDLAGDLPTTSGKWAWVVVGIDPSTNTATAVTGAEYDTQGDLTAARIADVDMADSIVCGAVQCREGDTSLADRSRYADARHWLGGHPHEHDAEYYPIADYLNSSAGAGDAGKPIVLSALGAVDKSMIPAFQNTGIGLHYRWANTIDNGDLPASVVVSGPDDCDNGVIVEWFVIRDPSGTPAVGADWQYVAAGASTTLLASGGDTLDLDVSGGGVVTLTGTLTVDHAVSLRLHWISG